MNILQSVVKGGLRLREIRDDKGRELQVQDVGAVYRGTDGLLVVRHSLPDTPVFEAFLTEGLIYSYDLRGDRVRHTKPRGRRA